MSAKTNAEVVIDGKVYTLSGYENEEYLQKVAAYINNKIAEFDDMDEYEEEEESEVVNEDSQNNSSLQNPGYETLDLDDLEREARIRKVMEDDEGEEAEE